MRAAAVVEVAALLTIYSSRREKERKTLMPVCRVPRLRTIVLALGAASVFFVLPRGTLLPQPPPVVRHEEPVRGLRALHHAAAVAPGDRPALLLLVAQNSTRCWGPHFVALAGLPSEFFAVDYDFYDNNQQQQQQLSALLAKMASAEEARKGGRRPGVVVAAWGLRCGASVAALLSDSRDVSAFVFVVVGPPKGEDALVETRASSKPALFFAVGADSSADALRDTKLFRSFPRATVKALPADHATAEHLGQFFARASFSLMRARRGWAIRSQQID